MQVIKKRKLNNRTFKKTSLKIDTSPIEEDPNKLKYYRRNLKRNSIELVFNEKPSEELRILIRDYGFKWGSKTKVWYRQFSSDAERAANLILKKLNFPWTKGEGEGDRGETNAKTKPKRKSIGSALKTDVWKLYWEENYKGACFVCGTKIDVHSFEAGHIRSVSKGGGDEIDNFLPVCRKCNSSGGMGSMCMIEYKKKHYPKTKVDSVRQPDFVSICSKCHDKCMVENKGKKTTPQNKRPVPIATTKVPERKDYKKVTIQTSLKQLPKKEPKKRSESKPAEFTTSDQWNKLKKQPDKAKKMLSALHMSPAYLKVSWNELDEGDQKKVSKWIAKTSLTERKDAFWRNLIKSSRTDT